MIARFGIRWHLFDWLILGYASLSILLLLAVGRPVAAFTDELQFFVAALVSVLVAVRYLDESRGGAHRFFRLLYPLILVSFFYRMTGGMMFLFFDGFLDHQVVSFEHRLFGFNPTIYLDRHLLNTVTNEILSLTYFLYYPLIPVFMLIVYIRGDYEVVKGSMAAVLLTFFLSYVLFYTYPVEGPRWHFAAQYLHAIDGPFFRQAVEFVQRHGSVRGGAMPSSHFAVTLVLTLFAGRYYPRWLWLLAPVSIGVAVGAVWGRYHYVSDVLVGGFIGLAVTLLAWRYAPAASASPRPCVLNEKETYPHHAS